MPNLERLLRKFSAEEKNELERTIRKIIKRDFVGLDYKRLKGHQNLFRVRKGRIRIIFTLIQKEAVVLAIERRREDTYKNF
ncbi:MAG: hypothetical protein A3C12_01940 [Candidatus Sungbacteria bacterium RIFCSPHIGHO2_02_FULL_49_20]|uniref:Cytotoxic translational repressor of toxin-antitoxin stability system n=1 Tax=Candidatus Sungbacteria bacterium RIFCSPHIGHO2_02_FULL_49_20 TaxID=1802272 RepID=A0A1G2KRB9_9BACT|nr:MAG: hypothetical protein A3C12_01940 [Candidatus Sungbacteria bacterium RIFCSPHIGHO2_02_FULL_49_20]